MSDADEDLSRWQEAKLEFVKLANMDYAERVREMHSDVAASSIGGWLFRQVATIAIGAGVYVALDGVLGWVGAFFAILAGLSILAEVLRL